MKLYLGVVPKDRTWYNEEILAKMKQINAGIVFSYFVFRKKLSQIITKGIHDYFDFDGPIMIDSGAYSAWGSDVVIHPKEYLDFLKQIQKNDDDIIVNLDTIGDPISTKSTWLYLKDHLNLPILPVIHCPSLAYSGYEDEEWIGLGGMVKSLKINEAGSVYDLVHWFPKLASGHKYHGFGMGSPLNQIIFEKYLHSVDWMGWRRNAAVCSIYTPEGSRTVQEARKKPRKDKPMTEALFESYKPPFLEEYNSLYIKGTEGWKNRALWNIWQFLMAQESRTIINQNAYVKRLKRQLQKEASNLTTFLAG